MKMREINDETMEYVGILAKLELSQEEREKAKRDMEEMLDFVDKLEELDTTGVEPMTHLFTKEDPFREDEESLDSSPIIKEGYYKVPKTIE